MACSHCAFKGDLTKLQAVTLEREDLEFGQSVDHILEIRRCPACDELTLESYWWPDWYDGEDGPPAKVTRLYPTGPPDNGALPRRVRDAYEAALKVKRIEPTFYAVGIRRTLEAICNTENA